ncbi:SecDF P1 head subdomain-containing protein [Kribbella solani]|uniref:SecDF P1 head subdomain domain-containing protein n=1 Tax=Kribbella solani TaxID=236067 RepID=A0A841DW18_9ACTN|nr:hypothetical protein [Kribbella solani]MBB5980930.1 hypothetical protein [Kribbella solani]
MTQPPVPPNDSNNPQDQPHTPNQPPPPQNQQLGAQNQPPGAPGQQSYPPNPAGQPPYPPGPHGNAPFQPGFQGQQPYAPVPRKVSRGTLALVIGLAVVLVALVATGVIIAVNRSKEPSISSAPPTVVPSKPSAPTAVEFRRVITSQPGTCPTPAPKGTACDEKGNRYTLGKVELDGSNVSGVKLDTQKTTGDWLIAVTLDAEGAKLFEQLTAGLAKQNPPANQLAILVRGQVVTAPTVMSAIAGGKVEITGGFTRADAEGVVNKIVG